MCGMRMPARYLAEMFCDRVAASKTYRGAAYTDRDAWDYYMKSRDHYLLHPETRAQLEQMLTVLKDQGEDAAFRWIRENVLKQ